MKANIFFGCLILVLTVNIIECGKKSKNNKSSSDSSYSKYAGPCKSHSKSSSSSRRHLPWDYERCPKPCFNCGKDCRVYTFGLFEAPGLATFNGTEMVGAIPELINEVCRRAKKRCRTALVEFDDCHDGRRSYILDKNVYDVCVVVDTPIRRSAYDFAKNSPGGDIIISGIVREDSSLEAVNFTEPNNFTLVYFSNPSYSTFGAFDAFLATYQVNETVGVNNGALSADTAAAINLVQNDNETIALIPLVDTSALDGKNVREILRVDSGVGGPTPMVRKDEIDILCWWDAFFLDLVCGDDYAEYCERVNQKLGEGDLNCRTGDQIVEICGDVNK